jgi:hypothetical protein
LFERNANTNCPWVFFSPVSIFHPAQIKKRKKKSSVHDKPGVFSGFGGAGVAVLERPRCVQNVFTVE